MGPYTRLGSRNQKIRVKRGTCRDDVLNSVRHTAKLCELRGILSATAYEIFKNLGQGGRDASPPSPSPPWIRHCSLFRVFISVLFHYLDHTKRLHGSAYGLFIASRASLSSIRGVVSCLATVLTTSASTAYKRLHGKC